MEKASIPHVLETVLYVCGSRIISGDCQGYPGSSGVNGPLGIGDPPESDIESRWEEIVETSL